MNGGTHQCIEQSPQGLVSASTRRNEATSGQQIAALTSESLMAVRFLRVGVDARAGAARSHLSE